MSAFAGLLLPIIAAWGLIRALPGCDRSESPLMTAPLAFGVGIGLSSITTLLCITHGLAMGRTFVGFDAALWALVAAIAWQRALQHRRPQPDGRGRSRLSTADWVARGGFVAVLVLVLAAATVEYARAPHGQWDAWAIWNQKARFLLRGGTDDWKGMLSIQWANPGHPMLVSASVARLWAYSGSEPTLIPAALAVLFAIAIAFAVIAALDPQRPHAWLAGALVIAPTTFVHQVAAQTADLPLAFFMVVTLVKLRDFLRTGTPALASRALATAGVFAGLAAWTKNEGLVLVAGTTLVLVWAAFRRRRVAQFLWWGVGLAAPVCTVLWYKLIVAPVAPEYMPATETVASITGRMLDPLRLAAIGSASLEFLVRWGGHLAAGVLPLVMGAAIVAAVPRWGVPLRYVLATLAIMAISYVALWLSAPYDATWLVTTTFDRLMVQLWPTLVVTGFSLKASPRS